MQQLGIFYPGIIISESGGYTNLNPHAIADILEDPDVDFSKPEVYALLLLMNELLEGLPGIAGSPEFREDRMKLMRSVALLQHR